jgi:serine protease Do
MKTTSIARAALVAGLAGLLAISGRVSAQGRPQTDSNSRTDVRRGPLLTLGPTLGIEVRDASSAELTAGAAVVTAVVADGAAQRVGVAVGDVIVELDGERVRGATQLARLVRESVPDRALKIVVVRDKARRTLDVTPAGAPRDVSELGRQIDQAVRDLPRELDRLRAELDIEGFQRSFPFSARRRVGIEVQPLSSQLASFFGVSDGLLVATVAAGSPAAAAGVKAGDVVTAANGRPVRVVDDLVNEVSRASGTVTLSIVRDRKELSLGVTVPVPESQSRPRPRGRTI